MDAESAPGSEQPVATANGVLREEVEALLTNEEVARSLGAMPLCFARNDGQWPEEIRFGARGHGLTVAFTDRGMTLAALTRRADGADAVRAVAFDFYVGRDGHAPSGERRLHGVHHYLVGNDASDWRTDVPLYEAIRYEAVAPGVALVVSDRDGSVAYDLHVDAGADLSAVEISCDGIDSVEVMPDGSLVLSTPDGSVHQSPPKAWYETDRGETRPADCRFRRIGRSSWGFSIEGPDPGGRLIVDPSVGLTWSTFLGSSEDDAVYGVDLLDGEVTVTGSSRESTILPFPTTSGVFQTNYAGSDDAFVTRFDPSKTGTAQLVWSTLIGGSGSDTALSLDLTSTGRVAVCGKSSSSNFPTTATAYSVSILNPGGENVFVLLLNSTGSALDYASYYGPSNAISRANSVKASATTELTFVGYAEGQVPLVNAYDPDYDGNGDGFIARFNPALTGTASLIYSSHIGDWPGSIFSAPEYDEAFAVALEGPFVYLVGTTESTGFHTASLTAIFDNLHGTGAPLLNKDCFVMRHRPDFVGAAQVSYCTFVGNDHDEEAFGVDVFTGLIYFCGYTESPGFPTGSNENVNFSYDMQHNSLKDAFAFKLNPNHTNQLQQLRYSSFLGRANDEIAYSVARVNDRCMVVVGMTESGLFPTAAPGGASVFDNSLGGARDAFLSRFRWNNDNAAPAQLDYSTFLGGLQQDEARSVVIDSTVEAYFGGWTASAGFPTTTATFDPSFNGGMGTGDAMVGWFTFPPVNATP